MRISLTRERLNLAPARGAFGRLGRRLLLGIRQIGRAGSMLLSSILAAPYLFRRRMLRETVAQMYVMGIKSLSVITVVAVFTGMILALQTGLELRKWNQEMMTGAAVMVSMLREMGPFMTGLILGACVGSSIAAQLGTMAVNDEIAALEIMSIDPIRFLMLPRTAAMAVMSPLLSFYTCLMGVLGGGVVANTQLNVPWHRYMDYALEYAGMRSLYVGLLKAFVSGLIIVTVACYQGFTTTNGAVGVGISTRRSVVVSFLLVLVSGYFLTRMFYS